jgi:hypothetical protein
MGSGVSEGPSVPMHPLSGNSSSISPLEISSCAAAAAAEISAAERRWTISQQTGQSKSLTVRPASSGWRATCSASAFSFAAAMALSSSPSWMMKLRRRRGGGTSAASYHQIKASTPLLKPKLRLPYPELQALAVL